LAHWLDTALEAGLDPEGIIALFTSALHDRTQRSSPGKARRERGAANEVAAS
jgi:hypothetical protein